MTLYKFLPVFLLAVLDIFGEVVWHVQIKNHTDDKDGCDDGKEHCSDEDLVPVCPWTLDLVQYFTLRYPRIQRTAGKLPWYRHLQIIENLLRG